MITAEFENLVNKEKVFGLYIINSKVRGLILKEKRGKVVVKSFADKDLPASAIVGGIIRRTELVTDILKQVRREAKPYPIRTPYVICSIPKEKVFIKVEEFPKLGEDKLKSAIEWKSKSIFGMPSENIYIDWHEINPTNGTSKSTVTVLIAAVEREVLDTYIEVLESAGLIPLGFEIQASAAFRGLIPSSEYEKSSAPWLLVDIGNNYSTVSIYHNYGLRFNSCVYVGGMQFAKIISSNLGISLQKALKYMNTQGLDVKDIGLKKELIQSLQPIITEVKNAISFYDKSPNKQDDIERLVLYGDSAYIKGLPEVFKQDGFDELDIKYADTRIPIEYSGSDFTPQSFLSNLIIFGLALRGVTTYQKIKDINLLPERLQENYKSEKFRNRINSILKVFSINIFAIVIFMVGMYYMLANTQKDLDDHIKNHKLLLESTRVTEMSNEVGKFNSSLNVITKLIASELNWLSVFNDLFASVPSGVKVRTVDIYIDENNKSTEPRWLVEIYGESDNRQLVIDMSDHLKGYNEFSNVKIPVSTFSSSEKIHFQIKAYIEIDNLFADKVLFEKTKESSVVLDGNQSLNMNSGK